MCATNRLLWIIFLFLSVVCSANGQKVSGVDFDVIKQNISNPASPFHYPGLLKKFQAADTTLTADDYTHLYYGQVFQDTYSPYSADDDDFLKVYNNQQYQEAIPLGETVLAQHPLSLKVLFKLLVCYDALGNKVLARSYARRYFSLSRAIVASGDGKSHETAYVVTAVPDEYQVVRDLELQPAGRQSLIGQTDVLTVKAENAKDDAPSRLYFNVSQPLAHLRGQFNKK